MTAATRGRVTIHMAASLDGYIARDDGRVDWIETSDSFPDGVTMDPEAMMAFLKTIDCYVMGARTYETALAFERSGAGWAYGATPTVVLTHRELPRTRETVSLRSGDVAALIAELRERCGNIWVVGGAALCTECLRLGLVDEIRYTILPVMIGAGLPFFGTLPSDRSLHLLECKAYRNGMVELRYEVVASPVDGQ